MKRKMSTKCTQKTIVLDSLAIRRGESHLSKGITVYCMNQTILSRLGYLKCPKCRKRIHLGDIVASKPSGGKKRIYHIDCYDSLWRD